MEVVRVRRDEEPDEYTRLEEYAGMADLFEATAEEDEEEEEDEDDEEEE